MLCLKHRVPLQYFSILQEQNFFAELLCNECLTDEKKLKFQVNYFLMSSLENGLLVKQLESHIADILSSKPLSFQPNIIQTIESRFEDIIKQILTLKENFIQDIEKKSIKFQSKSTLSLINEFSLTLSSYSCLNSSRTTREQLANSLTKINERIDDIKKFSHQNPLIAFKIQQLQLQEFDFELQKLLNKFNGIFTNQDYIKDINLQACDDVYHLTPNFGDLSIQSSNNTHRELLRETMENFAVLTTKTDSVLLTETLDNENRTNFRRLWNPKSLKPLFKYPNYGSSILPFTLTRKKNYFIEVQNYNTGGPQCLNCLSVSRFSSKGIKRIAKIVTRILSHIECVEEHNNIFGAEKLVLFAYNIFTRQCVQKLVLTDTINVLKYVPHLNLLLIGGVQIQAYNLVKGLISTVKYTLEHKGSSLAQVQVDNIRNNLYCFHSDGLIRIWKLTKETCSLLNQISINCCAPSEVYIFPDEQLLILNSFENKVYSLNLSNQNHKVAINDMDQILGLVLDKQGYILIIFQKGSKITMKKISTHV